MNPYTIEEAELRRKAYEAAIAINEQTLTHVRALSRAEVMEHETGNLLLRLRAEIYGIDHPKRHVIRYPENWWEAIKERFAPTWFRDRFPVRFVEVSASLEETYPDISAAIPDQRPVMKVAVSTRIDTPIW